MKKKIAALLTVAAMAMSFTGCGDSEKETTTEKATTEAATTEAVTTEAATTEVNAADTQISAERGTITDGVFTNKTFKISFPIATEYNVYTDELIATIMGLGQDLMEDNGIISAESYENALSGTIYDFMMVFPDMQSNVSVSYINLDKSGVGSLISMDVYVEATTSQLEQMTTPKYTINETTTETYGGQEYTCINVDTDQGLSQKMLLRKESGYMVMITITYVASSPELASDFLNSLTAVE